MIQFFITTLRLARSVVSAFRRDPQFRSLVFLVFITLLSGTIFYTLHEGWSVVDAFYFSVQKIAALLDSGDLPRTPLRGCLKSLVGAPSLA